MTQEELEQLFSKPLVWSFQAANVSGTSYYYPDGTAKADGRWGSVTGTYTIKEGMKCSHFPSIDKKPRCRRYYKVGPREYHEINPNTGALTAKTKLK